MDETKNIKNLLELLKKELVILYEYSEKSSRFPIKYYSGLDVLEDKNISKSYSEKTSNGNENFSPPIIKNEYHHNYKNFQKFQPQDIIRNKDKTYTYSPLERTYLSIFQCIRDLTAKFSIEDLLTAFTWQEFEQFISSALDHYGYHAFRTFRFTINKKRHEVDVLARDRNDILFIDAKRWNSKTANESALIKAAQEQFLRAQHLILNPNIAGRLLQKLNFPNQKFKTCRIYSIILVSSNLKENLIADGVPVLDFAHFNEFLNNFQSIKNTLKYVKLSKIVFQKKLM
ncbi:MAG: restriction endonuclease [Promethearchaeota archaeon]